MGLKTKIELSILAILAVVLGYYVYERIGMRMGGNPSPLLSSFESEETWILGEIVRDLAEMGAYARGVGPDAVEVALAPSGSAGAYRLEVRLGSLPLASRVLTVEGSLWSPLLYEGLASETFLPGVLFDAPPSGHDALAALVEPTVSVLESENARISARLAANIHDAAAHEEAALLLGAFALREATPWFEDVRFVLGRMTAHLAAARALRHGGSAGPSGRVAEATLLALSGRQREALGAIEALAVTGAEAPWRNALYMRSTDDWRTRAGAGRNLLERRERFRAMARALQSSVAVERMRGELTEAVADWGRIVTALHRGSVADRPVLESQIRLELAELREIWQLRNGSPLAAADLADVLNVPADRSIGPDGPRVLGWGVWASFLQRHLCGIIGAQVAHVRHSLGLPDESDKLGEETDRLFGDLRLAPILQVRRTRFPGARVETTLGMDASIALSRRAPELVTATNWHFLVETADYMMRKRGMPRAETWFSPNLLTANVLDPAPRLFLLRAIVDRERAVDEIRGIAPRHPDVIDMTIARMKPEERTAERLARELGDRIDFDLRAIDWMRGAVDENSEGGLDLLRRRCDLDPNLCAQVGRFLVSRGRTDEGRAAFEKMLREAPDRVRVCNNAEWLVDDYYEHGMLEEAKKVADEVAEVYCSWGLRTKAHLLERMGSFRQAEAVYQANAERYDGKKPVSNPLLGFYFRRAGGPGAGEYRERLQELLSRVFPKGLERLPAELDAAPPTDGVLVDGESAMLASAGLRGGDVIVGLDGYRVRTLEQYDAVMEFRPRVDVDAMDMRVRAFRQTRYFDVFPRLMGRRFDVKVRTYGTPGPSFQER